MSDRTIHTSISSTDRCPQVTCQEEGEESQGSLKRLGSQRLRLGPVGHPPSPPPRRTRVRNPPLLKRVRQKSPPGGLWVSRAGGSPPPYRALCSRSPLLRVLSSTSRSSHRIPPKGKRTHKARTGCAQLLQVGRRLAEDKSHSGGRGWGGQTAEFDLLSSTNQVTCQSGHRVIYIKDH